MEGATTARVFETYVERVLEPTLREGQVVVMETTPRHTKESELGSSTSGEGASCLTGPWNPIEEAFGKMKDFLRKVEARSREVLLEVLGAPSRRLPTKTPVAFSSDVATVLWFNRFDHRCTSHESAVASLCAACRGLAMARKRRGKGVGSIYLRKDGRWVGQGKPTWALVV